MNSSIGRQINKERNILMVVKPGWLRAVLETGVVLVGLILTR